MVWSKPMKTRAVATSCALAALCHASDAPPPQAVPDAPLDAVQRQLIEAAASLNALALACGRLSQSTADSARDDLREAIVSQGVAAPTYEAAYTQAQQYFGHKWQHASAQQQRSSCERMHWPSPPSAPAAAATAQ